MKWISIPNSRRRSAAAHPRLGSRRGFTLVEIMVVVMLFGLLMVAGVPPFVNYVRSNRLKTNSDRLASDLQLARSISIANGIVVRFTATTAGYEITDPVAATTLRQRDFDGGCALDADATADFFPWGMADTQTLNLSNCSGARVINLLPTGMVEVN